MVLWEEYDPGHPPFSFRIVDSPLPEGFQMPRIEPYDGSTDPHDHLRAFYVNMTLYGASDAIFCKAFPCTLTGPALRWFFTFPASSITRFSQLTHKFLKRFIIISSINFPTALTSLKQGDDESLKDYVSRFDKEAEKEVELSSRIYARLMIAGMKPGKFKESLFKKPLIGLEDLWIRASRFVDQDHNTQPPLLPCNKPHRDLSFDV